MVSDMSQTGTAGICEDDDELRGVISQAPRARGVMAPVLFLTARDGLSDRLSGCCSRR